MDLLQNYHLLPQSVQDLSSSFDENKDQYAECKRICLELVPLGYAADYDLSGELCLLIPLGSVEYYVIYGASEGGFNVCVVTEDFSSVLLFTAPTIQAAHDGASQLDLMPAPKYIRDQLDT